MKNVPMSPFPICGQKETGFRSVKRVNCNVHNDGEGNQSRKIEAMMRILHNTGFIPGCTEFILD